MKIVQYLPLVFLSLLFISRKNKHFFQSSIGHLISFSELLIDTLLIFKMDQFSFLLVCVLIIVFIHHEQALSPVCHFPSNFIYGGF